MARESFPKPIEAQIRKLATAQSFERGQRYFKDGAIIAPYCKAINYERSARDRTMNFTNSDQTPYFGVRICSLVIGAAK